MATRRKFLMGLGAVGAVGMRQAFGQVAAPPKLLPPVGDSGGDMEPPPKGYYPYAGVSGAGFAVTKAGARGGWVSGSKGLAYEGIHPPSFPTLPFGDAATGSVVTQGLLPAVKPLLDVQVRDTVICRGGDGHYYMTGSTGQNIWAFNDGVELWSSADLKKWKYLGLVWSIEKEGGWEKQWRGLHGKPSRAIWAPEIHYVRGNYYLCLSMAPSGLSLLKSTTGKATGPYVHAFSPDAPISGGIDATLFEDTDGAVYFTYGSATKIARMKDDMSGLAEAMRPVVLAEPDHEPTHHAPRCEGRGMNDLGTEGAVMFKAHGRYYLGAADEYQGRYSTCLAVSDNVYGPYRMRHESVPCAGGTGFFEDKKGRWWSTMFGNDKQAAFREKPAIVRVDFDPQGRVIVAKDQTV